MSIFKNIRNYENKVPYGLLGAIIGIGGIVISMYLTLVFEKSPKLEIDIVSQFNVLEVNESINNLDIIYETSSLKEQGQTLSVIELQVNNRGSAPVLYTYYDPKSEAGFAIENGTIPESPSIVSSNTSYEKNQIELIKRSSNSYSLPKLILNPSDYYSFKFIVLHSSELKPIVKAFGVIAGMDKIEIRDSTYRENDVSLIGLIFDGSYLVNFSRLIIFGIAFFILALVIILLISTCIDYILMKNKKKAIESFKLCNTSRLQGAPESFFKYFSRISRFKYEYDYQMLKKQNGSFIHNLNGLERERFGFGSYVGVKISEEEFEILCLDLLNLFVKNGLISEPKPEPEPVLEPEARFKEDNI